MSAASTSLTDEVIQEIGEQMSQVITSRAKWGKAWDLDLMSGIAIYQNHIKTAASLKSVRLNKSGQENQSRAQISGKSFEILDVHDRRHSGKIAYTTDELASLLDIGEDALFSKHPGLERYAKFNHPQTDVVELGSKGKFQTYQHKALDKPNQYYDEFCKDIENDRFVVPSDKYNAVLSDLDRRIKGGGEEGKSAHKIKKGLEKGSVRYGETKSPQGTHVRKVAGDAGKRTLGNVSKVIISDIAVFAFGGTVMEIREAYQNPHAMPLMERCKRLLRAIWEKLQTSFKDRALREIGSEVILGLTTVLVAPVKKARNAIRKVVDVLRRLWMQFVSGKIKTLAGLVSAALKAVFVVASIGIAFALEQWLSSMMKAIPGGDILAAVIAAALAGVMIVVANRSVEAVVQTLFGIFAKGVVARLRREEIQRLCDKVIPQLIEDRDRLEVLMESHFARRDRLLSSSFAQLRASRDLQDIDSFLNGLVELNTAYRRSLPWCSFQQFDQCMLDDKPMKF